VVFFLLYRLAMKKILYLTLISFVTSCNRVNVIETKAHIFERRILKNGKLMVFYAFNTGKSLIRDSLVLENKLLPTDSITVQYKIRDPNENDIIMPKGWGL